MSKVMIIGSDGMLGFDLMHAFGSDAVGLTHADIEVTDAESVKNALEKHHPDVVVTTAALLKSELCEREPAQCFNINAIGAFHVAKASKDIGATTIFISSDYVFGGGKEFFTEEDATEPLNVYGASKVAGEDLVAIANPNSYIIRSGWFFGDHVSHKGYDFPRLMLDKAKKQPFVAVVDDQRGTPTCTKDLAQTIKKLVDVHAPFGTYHMTHGDICSWYDYAKLVFELANVTADLRPIKTAESGSGIRRPDCSALKSSKLASLGIPSLRSLRDALKEYLTTAEDLP